VPPPGRRRTVPPTAQRAAGAALAAARRSACAIRCANLDRLRVGAPLELGEAMKRILVALDSSPRAPTVLAAAARLAESVDARLIVFRAVTVPPDLPFDVLAASDRSLEEVLIRNADADLERMTHDLPPRRIEKRLSALAVPWDGICRVAREQAVDLIVIGAHGYGGLDRLLGTTAGRVVNHADRNVLVVRAPL
jgi:universal stress protein F